MEAVEEAAVLIVGAGPAGLATAACLAKQRVPCVIVERESCSASLWRYRAYDRLKLHLAKEFCELPHMAYPAGTPTYVPRDRFVEYLDSYADRFGIRPRYHTAVESAMYDGGKKHWSVLVRETDTGAVARLVVRFLVVATGENSMPSIPLVSGLTGFEGKAIHSSEYKSGRDYSRKSVLVVGAGNSGMEIAYDLATHGAHTSIVVRSPVHIMTKELIRFGMNMVQNLGLPVTIVDSLLVMAAKFIFGDMSTLGITRPKIGPLLMKSQTGRSSVIDVGTAKLIKGGVIKVFQGISKINTNNVEFHGGRQVPFDTIVFATGYKSTVNMWLKNGESMFTKDGFPKKSFPNHWKGEDGLYCAGFARRGLAGIAMDAMNIADDIVTTMDQVPR
ncbi:probable indole-3-pyruvate monooxygenase YUCCA10 [Oryza brachyantha]|uniref:indole-3-pyruvate monooxygenase n=1 Tax=Oryza brachyantha TaxID=4533 RepID=B9V0I9_ORYBR|nr:probable indole-3-pyruvate monooxygenase YUCCA10 [Oryza brachyantha]ACM17555.1 flavin monoxygenase family-1 [Oryza brachyantha]